MANGRNVYSKIKKVADGRKCAALFLDDVSSYWLTGFYSTDGVVIVNESETLLCVDSRYEEAARMAGKAGELQSDVRVVLLDKGITAAITDNSDEKVLVFDSSKVTVARLAGLKSTFPKREFAACDNICGEFRMIKSVDELEKIKKAQSITDAAFDYILGFIRDGLTEREVAAELEYFVKRNGGDGMAFDTIAVTGSNSSLPHGVPGDTKLVMNSFLTMDFGARYKGYCSDMTRTVVLGKADDKMKKIYATVLEAQLAGIEAAIGGASGKQVDGVARKIIADAGYGANFGHSLGHSLGVEIHELPVFSPKSDASVPCGAVMSVEPGIYIQGEYGVRIEDIVYMTADGCEVLTRSPKKLIEL